jgi:integrase
MGVLTSNPASKVHPPKQERHQIVPMTPEEVKAILTAAETSRYDILYVLAITAGFRIGELLGLRWADINLDDGMLSVRHTLLRSRQTVRERLAPTKTRSGKRSLALSEMALNALREHRRRQLASAWSPVQRGLTTTWAF